MENQPDQATDTPDPTDAQQEAEFAAGFDDTPTPTPSEPATTPPKEDPAPEAQPEPEPEPLAQITQRQWEELTARAEQLERMRDESQQRFDNAFGQLGGLKVAIERIQSQTSAGQPVQFTAEDVADLSAQFPEIGELTLKALQKAAGKLRGTGAPPVDSAQFERMVRESAGTVRKELIDTALDAVLPDWENQVRRPEYAEWIAAQTPEIRALEASSSPREAARLLRLYAQRLAAPPPKPVVEAKPSSRQRQLQAAVNPKSASGPAPASTAEDEFLAGFNS